MNITNDKKKGNVFNKIDHVAIAVTDLEKSIILYRDILGFELTERRETQGEFSGMVSAVFSGGPFSIVLIQGTSAESQVNKYIEHYGPGVQHIAFGVENLTSTVDSLSKSGIEFATNVIESPETKQIFSKRDEESGMMFEIIERHESTGFSDNSVNQLFNQLESKNIY